MQIASISSHSGIAQWSTVQTGADEFDARYDFPSVPA
jgi:hypothetical protein